MTDQRRPDRPPSGASPRLSPPPKPAASAAPDLDDSDRRGASHWLTLGAFAVLAGVALAVFVVLPGWVEEHSRRTADAGPGEAAVTADPALEAPARPVPEPGSVTEPARPPLETLPPPADHAEVSTGGSTSGTGNGATADSAPLGARSRRPDGPSTSAVAADPRAAAFAAAMAEGLTGLERRDLAGARRAFEEALALSPGAPEATDGLARVEAAQQLLAIADHKERAEAFVDEERWGEAAAEYAAVLTLDPTIRFAQEGQERAEVRHRLSERFDAFLDRPERLSSEGVLAAARRLLLEAKRAEPPDSLLRERIDKLQGLVEVAATPIRVVLLSDGATEVLVYRVGRLGTFERRELDLRPGTYTVVGTRDGFKDVRHQLEVEPGGTPTLTVRCEERI